MDPRQRAARGAALLKQGDYAEGFPLFDAWREVEDTDNKAPALPMARWEGQVARGMRLLIWGEHGFGDQLMYARFARAIARHGVEVSWLCDPALVRLFQACLGVTALNGAQPFDLDFHA
jgi:hypothetical protein